MKYRKKPVVIEAVQFTGDNHFTLGAFCGRKARPDGDNLLIDTLEGEMTARPGDWIIQGVHGEFYPCKPDIFAATYEPA